MYKQRSLDVVKYDYWVKKIENRLSIELLNYDRKI
jgi:hypothetical protein